MSKPSDETVRIWLRMLNEGGWWTSSEIAALSHGDIDLAGTRLRSMHRLGLIARRTREPDTPPNAAPQYGVLGTCRIPAGITVAEAQA